MQVQSFPTARRLSVSSPEGPSSASGWRVATVVARARREVSSPWSEPSPWETAVCGANSWSVCSLSAHLRTDHCQPWCTFHDFKDEVWRCKGEMKRKTYLNLPSSEKRLIQCHGCPDRFFVCKLNIGKPEGKRNNLLSNNSTKIKTKQFCATFSWLKVLQVIIYTVSMTLKYIAMGINLGFYLPV